MGCVVECIRKGACPRTSFLTHFLLPHHNAGQGKCRPFAIVCSKWQMLLLAAFSFSFRLHCDEVVLSQVGLPPPQPFGLQGAGRKKRDCKKKAGDSDNNNQSSSAAAVLSDARKREPVICLSKRPKVKVYLQQYVLQNP
jgi:hypothetical protein